MTPVNITQVGRGIMNTTKSKDFEHFLTNSTISYLTSGANGSIFKADLIPKTSTVYKHTNINKYGEPIDSVIFKLILIYNTPMIFAEYHTPIVEDIFVNGSPKPIESATVNEFENEINIQTDIYLKSNDYLRPICPSIIYASVDTNFELFTKINDDKITSDVIDEYKNLRLRGNVHIGIIGMEFADGYIPLYRLPKNMEYFYMSAFLLIMNKNNKYKVLSLFTGIGGMDMGFDSEIVVHEDSIINKEFIDKRHKIKDFVILKKNNFECIFQNDILEGAKEVFGLNNDDSKYNTTSIYNLIKENFKFPDADIIIGGFPCQDFSHAGKRKGFESNKGHDLKEEVNTEKENSRGTLYKSFVEVVKKVKPKIFVAENVYGLVTMKNEPIKQIMSDFSELGYDVNYQVIDCSEYGIPQTRKRVIIMGISKNRKKDIDEEWNMITKNKIKCKIGKYFEHLLEPNMTNDIFQMVYSKAKKLQKGQGQTEINLESFAPTIRAEHHGNIEFRRHENSQINIHEKMLPERRLTVRETGLVQTFPPNYIFSKKKKYGSI
jgi:DNA (cytosine-5)-methyltransferase 1